MTLNIEVLDLVELDPAEEDAVPSRLLLLCCDRCGRPITRRAYCHWIEHDDGTVHDVSLLDGDCWVEFLEQQAKTKRKKDQPEPRRRFKMVSPWKLAW